MSQLILQPFRRFIYATAHSPTLPPLHLRHKSFYNPSVVSSTSQALHVLHLANHPCIGGWKNSLSDNLFQQVTKFRSQLLRILLRAVNLFSFSHIVSSDSNFNIHNALYFVKYPYRAAQNSLEGRRRPAGRGLKTPGLHNIFNALFKTSKLFFSKVAILSWYTNAQSETSCSIFRNEFTLLSTEITFLIPKYDNSMAERFERSTSGFQSSRFGRFMWGSWWINLVESRISRFPVLACLKSYWIAFSTSSILISFHPPLWWCVRFG